MGIDKQLLEDFFSNQKYHVEKLKGDGSDRKIFRVRGANQRAILIQSENITENKDFLLVTKSFQKNQIPVPAIYAVNPSKSAYLLEDLGNHTLADKIDQNGPDFAITAYQKVLDYLIKIQNRISIDLLVFLSDRPMSKKLYQDDLEYFCTAFLRQYGYENLITPKINQEMYQLVSLLENIPHDQFVYRDFQSRNIMWQKGEPVFIDYQSAMLGSVFYDLGSMLYSSKSGLNDDSRAKLIAYYYECSGIKMSYDEFLNTLYRYILLRRLRSLGSYGYLSQKGKNGFLDYIPKALKEMIGIFQFGDLIQYQQLYDLIDKIREDWMKE